MREYLKIKCVSLADEAKRIRKEEMKTKTIIEDTKDPSSQIGYYTKRLDRISREGIIGVAPKYVQETQETLDKWMKRAAIARNKSAINARYVIVRHGLAEHRKGLVRSEARAANLAYGFVRGRSYKEIEQTCHNPPNWNRVEKLVTTYGEGDSRDIAQRFAAWKAEAIGEDLSSTARSLSLTAEEPTLISKVTKYFKELLVA